MEIICPKEDCTGCAACMNVCPKAAITMQPQGTLKHIHPVIDPALCIDCGLCARTCPVNHPVELRTPLKAFAAISKEKEDLMTSSSGGAASVLTTHILKQGGVVYGCVQKNYKDIAHRRIDSLEEASSLKGSKYVQSHIGLAYRGVKADLKAGRTVLFTGTPCQIAGLRAFLRKDYENLYLVDLVCHGVPSQHLLQENVEQMLGKRPVAPPYVDFRKKQEPLARMYGTFLRNSPSVKEKQQLFLHNDYITAFMCGLTFRSNCFHCRYAQSRRGSDITISDFWGIGQSSVPTENGISLMLQNSEKGGRLITAVQPACHWQERPVVEAIQGNGQLMHACPSPKNRGAFEIDYARSGTAAYKRHLKKYRYEWRAEHNMPTLEHRLRRVLAKLRKIGRRIPLARALYHLIIRK